MKIPIYVLDSFSDTVFKGNPAAVCPLGEWLPDDLMQRIAMENNLSETAFLVKEGEDYRVRWFTPGVEVDLAPRHVPLPLTRCRTPRACLPLMADCACRCVTVCGWSAGLCVAAAA